MSFPACQLAHPGAGSNAENVSKLVPNKIFLLMSILLPFQPRSKKRTRQTDDSLEDADQDRGTDDGVQYLLFLL